MWWIFPARQPLSTKLNKDNVICSAPLKKQDQYFSVWITGLGGKARQVSDPLTLQQSIDTGNWD